MQPLPHSAARRPPVAYFVAAAATLLVAALLRYPSLFEPRWYGDEGIFAAVAQNIRHGQTLYSDAWDNKPPLIFYTYAGVQSAFGNNVFALHLVATLVVLCTQVVVMAIALLQQTAKRSLVAGLLFAFLMGTPIIEGNLAMTETFMILPTSLAMLVYVLAQRRPASSRRVYYVAAGLLIGIAAGYKQVAIFDGMAIGVMIWLTQDRPWKALTALGAGCAAPQIVLAVMFLASGSFGSYWYAIVGSLGVYSDLGDRSPVVRFVGYLPAIIATAWLVRRKQLEGSVELEAFPVLWLGFAIAGATSSTFAFPHYLQQAAPAIALTVAANPLRWERDETGQLALAIGGVLIAAVVFGQFSIAFGERKQLDPVTYYRTFASHRYGTMSDVDYDYYFDGKVATVDDIVGFIRQDGAGNTAYTWSELPWIYAAGDLTNPTRYYTSFLGEVIPGAKQEILRDLEARPPTYVVISDDTFAPFRELDGFVAARYELLRSQNDWRLYRLDGAGGRLAPEAARPTPGRREATILSAPRRSRRLNSRSDLDERDHRSVYSPRSAAAAEWPGAL